MDLDRVVSELGIGESRELLELAWDASQDAMPEGEVGFLSPAFLREACRGVYLPEEITEARLRRHGGWEGIPRCARWPGTVTGVSTVMRIIRAGSRTGGRLWRACLGMRTVCFTCWCCCPGSHIWRRSTGRMRFQSRLSGRVWTRSTSGACRAAGMFGRWGLDGHAARWLSNYLWGEIYALGRLVHQFRVIDDPIRVYRHGASSMVIALSEDGVSYRADGQRFRRGDIGRMWRSRLVVAGEEIVGASDPADRLRR